jgi:hypothetical protein
MCRIVPEQPEYEIHVRTETGRQVGAAERCPLAPLQELDEFLHRRLDWTRYPVLIQRAQPEHGVTRYSVHVVARPFRSTILLLLAAILPNLPKLFESGKA